MSFTLIIADDHPLLIDGLMKVLQEIAGISIQEPALNGFQLLNSMRKDPADLILLDLHMPQLDGIDTLRILKKEFPRVKIIIFTSYDQAKLVRETRSLGIQGFLPKSTSSSTLKEAVLAVSAGNTWFREPQPGRNAPADRLSDDFLKRYQVTKREVEIIRKIAEGLTSKEIGEQLFISEFTINTHRRNICRKLNLYTPVALLNFAKEHGIV